jgi:pyruvate dehydrogenase E1 component
MFKSNLPDIDPTETAEWIESIRAVQVQNGDARAQFLLGRLIEWGRREGVVLPFTANTDYVNSIPREEEAPYPGDRDMARRIKSMIRWNAMAMVVRANRESSGIGGHISTYASSATLMEVGFNHFFHAKSKDSPGDQIYFQGHAAPGIYGRAFLEYRLEPRDLENFRRELSQGGGLSSYPHPWLMPNFWEFPTVSMGLGPINAIYQARFNRYLMNRSLIEPNERHVWAFLGDGEMDEPESLGAITLASRESLDNLIFVINCNLQRLDGPVRGNGQIIQELEATFRGAGWNVIKVIWGEGWLDLLENDTEGLIVQRMNETIDGMWQKYSVEDGAYARKNFFGTDPRLLKMVEHLTDEQIYKLKRGGHDPIRVYAAYKAAVDHKGSPTVILAKTIKGYGLGEAGEGRNITHQQKKLNDEELRQFRNRFDIPIKDADLHDAPFYRPEKKSPEYEYLMARREALGGFVPQRKVFSLPIDDPPSLDMFADITKGSGDRDEATTMGFVRILAKLMSDKKIGPSIVPIVPDEARTFGLDALFRKHGIYAHKGQLYEPVDSHLLLYYREDKAGQILEEGITEAGSFASFTAAGTAYATHGINMIPFFIFYSMFGFQRIGDLAWAFGDSRGRGFLLGATAGRTTLAGEGLQHQDGHSHVLASTFPTLQSYDPAYAYEIAVIVQDGIRRMFTLQEDIYYYITVENETYIQPPMPSGVEEGILKGLYKVRPADNPGNKPRLHLFGSGPILNATIRAQELLAEKFDVAADVWSATSFNLLRRDALACDRWNRLHPTQKPRMPFLTRQLAAEPWPVVAATDYMRVMADQVAPWCPSGLRSLGTDGFGRSESRDRLRRHFENDAEHIAVAALYELSQQGKYDPEKVADGIRRLELDPEKVDPAFA